MEEPKFHQNKIALVYDFDGTLSPKAMQEYGILPLLGVEASEFWGDVKKERTEKRSEELLVYMHRMIKLADAADLKLTRADFVEHGKKIEFFEGVEGWFERINKYVRLKAGTEDVQVEHYIVSAGLKEIIDGCAIADRFKEIYACELSYSQYGHPEWPARVISDTTKTQYLFRINKGVLDVNKSINSHMPVQDRRIPFDSMIYFGDGDTDVPSMALAMQNGAHAVAVYPQGESDQKCQELKQAGRIDYFCPANYSDGSELDRLVKNTLDVIVSRISLRRKIFDLPPKGHTESK